MPQEFAFNVEHHLPTFGMEYPDNRIKTSFLLNDLSNLSNRNFKSRDLDRYGLQHGVDYFTITKSEVSDLHFAFGDSVSRRVVLSYPGMLKLVIRARTAFGEEVVDYVLNDVLPALTFAQPQINDHPTLHLIRDVVTDLTEGIAGQAQEGVFNSYIGQFGMGSELRLRDMVGSTVNVVRDS